ncbi:MAG TPA: hypothetical protein VK177_03120 [Flavobacteriales bacterium]|nr:hypothetical protein [Flavobacteriales bacterium]
MKHFTAFILFFFVAGAIGYAQEDSTYEEEEDTLVLNEREMEFIKTMPADQNNAKLESELKALTNCEQMSIYLYEHAAKYADFDSLYPIITGEKCPKNYTFNLLHEKLDAYPAKVNAAFLLLVSRNFIALGNANQSSKLIRDYNLRSEWFRQYVDELKKMDRNNFYLPDYRNGVTTKFQKMNSPYFLKETITVKKEGKPVSAYLEENMYNFEHYYNDRKNDRKPNKGKSLTYYWTHGDIETETMAGTKLEDAIQQMITAQFFNDVVFIYLNGRFVWFDISK